MSVLFISMINAVFNLPRKLDVRLRFTDDKLNATILDC